MKNYLLFFLALALSSCNTIKINGENYKKSTQNERFGVIGHTNSFYKKNRFISKGTPKFDSKIKLEVGIVPFTKNMNKIFQLKSQTIDSLQNIVFVDSINKKPELVVINLLDVVGFTTALNNNENVAYKNYFQETKNTKIITEIAILFKDDDLQKIKNADTYYLLDLNNQNYKLGLFKNGKQLHVVDINSSLIIGYNLSKFCWIKNKKGDWEIIDLVKSCKNCKGNSKRKVDLKKKKQNLYKL